MILNYSYKYVYTIYRGTPKQTNWFKMLKYIYENPGCVRGDIQENVMGKERDSKHGCDVYTTFLSDGIICKVRNGRTFRYYITDHGYDLLNGALARENDELVRVNTIVSMRAVKKFNEKLK